VTVEQKFSQWLEYDDDDTTLTYTSLSAQYLWIYENHYTAIVGAVELMAYKGWERSISYVEADLASTDIKTILDKEIL
jgi:hypothetical protein